MKAIHYGIIATDASGLTFPGIPLNLPMGMQTDGDSFLVWGEINQTDGSLHVLQYVSDNVIDIGERILEGRSKLALTYFDDRNVRLVDYVAITDADDWSDGQRIWLLDGTIS